MSAPSTDLQDGNIGPTRPIVTFDRNLEEGSQTRSSSSSGSSSPSIPISEKLNLERAPTFAIRWFDRIRTRHQRYRQLRKNGKPRVVAHQDAADALDRLRNRPLRWAFRPWHMVCQARKGYCSTSKYINFLWPFVPVGIVMYFVKPDWHLYVFVFNYIAMAPAANLVGFASQELTYKLGSVSSGLVEIASGAMVEIVMFTILIVKMREDAVGIIRHAILGSILANLLLCLGACFFVGGIWKEVSTFHEQIAEAGAALVVIVGLGLSFPAIFSLSATMSSGLEQVSASEMAEKVLRVSRLTAIILLLTYICWLCFQTKTHRGLFDSLLRANHELNLDVEKISKNELTMTETLVVTVIGVAAVSLISLSLVEQIHFLVEERHLKDSFVGLILLPLVEKIASHFTVVDEAWKDQMDLALAQVFGSSAQTALFNTPYIVFLGWAMNVPMNLEFAPFETAAMILTVVTVNTFLNDERSNYFEGILCVSVYVLLAICAYEMPNPATLAH